MRRGSTNHDTGRSTIEIALEGRTYDIPCLVSPPALLNRTGPPLGDAEFDARHDVVGAPRAVLTAVFHPDLRARMKMHPSSVRFAGDRLELVLDSSPRSVDSVAASLGIAAAILDQLPDAIRAGGAGQYLDLGSLATHPEVVTQSRGQGRIRLAVLAIAGLAVGLCVLGAVVVAVVVWWAMARSP